MTITIEIEDGFHKDRDEVADCVDQVMRDIRNGYTSATYNTMSYEIESDNILFMGAPYKPVPKYGDLYS